MKKKQSFQRRTVQKGKSQRLALGRDTATGTAAKTSVARFLWSWRKGRTKTIRQASRRLVRNFFDSTFRAAGRLQKGLHFLLPNLSRQRYQEVKTQLTQLLGSANPAVRLSALTAWSRLPYNSDQNTAFHILTLGLRDYEPSVRLHSLKLLGQFVKQYEGQWERAVPLLRDCCLDQSGLVAREAKRMLCRGLKNSKFKI